MTKQFDLSVIGTGNAASTTRLPVVKPDDGSRSSILFRLPEPVLFGAAEFVGWQDGSEEKAFARRGLRLDWPDLVRFKRVGIARNGDMCDRAVQAWSEHKISQNRSARFSRN